MEIMTFDMENSVIGLRVCQYFATEIPKRDIQ